MAPLLAYPPRWPVECARKLGVQATSRSHSLVRRVAVDDSKTPEYANHVDVRLDVDLSLLPSEAPEIVPEYPRRHRRDAGTEPVDLLQRLVHLGGGCVLPDGTSVSAEPLADQSGGVGQRLGALPCTVPGAHWQTVQQPGKLRFALGGQHRWIQKPLPLDLGGNPVRDVSSLGDIGSLEWLVLPGHPISAAEDTLWRLTELRGVWYRPLVQDALRDGR